MLASALIINNQGYCLHWPDCTLSHLSISRFDPFLDHFIDLRVHYMFPHVILFAALYFILCAFRLWTYYWIKTSITHNN